MVDNYKNINPLIIGLGVAGRRHLEAQLNLGIKTGIYSTNPQTNQFYKKNANVIVFDNLKPGLDWSNLVHVCTPDDKHTEYVAAAIKKRKTVLCEKAFTTNLKDAIYLQKLAHEYDATVIVGQNYRLTPTFAETRKRILDGQLGRITHIQTTYFHDTNDYQKRYKSKDFLYIGGSHAVDLALWIANEQITSIEASSKNKLNYQITLKFVSGISADIKLDATANRSTNGTDLIVHGEKGRFVSNNKKDELLFYEEGRSNPQSIKLPNTGTHTISKEVKIIDDYLLGKVSSFWPLPDVDQAVNTTKILDAIIESTSSSKSEVI